MRVLRCAARSFNPDGLPHGAPNATKKFGASASHYMGEGSRYWRHVGDVGNVTADASGAIKARTRRRRTACTHTHAAHTRRALTAEPPPAQVSFEEPVITLSGPNSIVGRSVVIHADADDYVNEPKAIVAFGTLAAQ